MTSSPSSIRMPSRGIVPFQATPSITAFSSFSRK
jgi:hypothetical protein